MKNLIKAENRSCPICKNHSGYLFKNVNGFKIIKCNNCKMVFVDVDSNIAENANKLDETAFDFYYMYEPVYTLAYYDLVLEKIQRHFGKSKIKILEFGCGSGMFMRRAIKKNIDIYGLDFSPYSRKAKELFNLNIDTNELSNTIYNKKEFDVIISHCTYEHLYAPLEVTQKLLKLLKKDGLFIISGVPNFDTFTIKLFKNFWNNHPPVHVNHFEIESLNLLFKEVGIKTIKTKTYGWNIWFLWYLWFKLSTFFKLKEKNSQSDKQVNVSKKINSFSNYKSSFIHRLIANIYYKLVIYGKGKNLEIWGINSNKD